MEIKLTKQTTVQEIINIEVPAFFKTDFGCWKILDGKIIYVNKRLCTVSRDTDFGGLEDKIQEALKGVKITEEEFNNALLEFQNNLSS